MTHSRGARSISRNRTEAPKPIGASALRRSALQRLGFAAIPIAALWLAVVFALDAFA